MASQYARPAIKAFLIILSILVLAGWGWLSEIGAELALDYPLRRAGESELFPALGTPAFYTNCAKALLDDLTGMLIIFGLPLALSLFYLLRNCGIKSRLCILLVLAGVTIGPLACFGALEIHQHMSRVKEYQSKVSHS